MACLFSLGVVLNMKHVFFLIFTMVLVYGTGYFCLLLFCHSYVYIIFFTIYVVDFSLICLLSFPDHRLNAVFDAI